jgi:hypothetical protein
MIARFSTAAVSLFSFGFLLVTLLSSSTVIADEVGPCVDIAGVWNYSESGTVTCSADGESETIYPYGSGTVTVIQDGCTVTYYVPNTTYSRSGTVVGNSIQVTGVFVVPLADGVSVTENAYTGSGTISSDERRINLSGSGYASGFYEGIYGECTGTSQVTLTNPGRSHTLTLTTSGTGSGTVSSSPSGIECSTTCSASYTSGTSITLTATPAEGSTFTSWSGCGSVSGDTCIVTLTADTQVTAAFTSSGWLTVPRSGLVGEWLFEGDARDTSGKGHDGIVHGTVLSEDRLGRANAAYSFDGVGAYLSIPNHGDFNLTGNYAFSVWIYQKSAIPTWSFRILDKATAARCDGWNLDTWDGSTGRKVRLDVGCPWTISNSAYSLNEWHHVVASVNQRYVTFYLDAQPNGGGSIPATPTNSLDVYIGAAHNDSSCFFDGVIDDVRIYNRALSPSEVAALYNDKERMYLDSVQKTFIGYYHRPADPGGLIYWAGRLNASGGNLTDIVEAFAHSEESQALYGTIDSSSISTVVNGIYYALFGRDAEAEGLNWYVSGFNSGKYTAATIMLDILYGAQNEDLQSVNHKLAAANLFTRTIDPELDGTNFQVTYSGEGDVMTARNLLASVTGDPATVPTQDEIIAYMKNSIADSGDPIFGQ